MRANAMMIGAVAMGAAMLASVPAAPRRANVEYSFIGSDVTFNTRRDAVVSINPTIPGPDIDPIAGAVPEPATWAMLLLGSGAIGAVTRRRRRRAVFRLNRFQSDRHHSGASWHWRAASVVHL